MSNPRSKTERLAAAIADGEAIDWSLVESPEPGGHRQLEVLWKLATRVREDTASSGSALHRASPAVPLPLWLIAVLAVAASHLLAALVAWVFTPADRSPVPSVFLIAAMATLGISGLVLLVGGRRDRRARYLGAFFICSAASLAPRFVAHFRPFPRGLGWWAALHVETFMPLLMWQFVRDFPRLGRFTRYDLVARVAIVASAVSGSVLFVANVAPQLAPWTQPMVEGVLRGSRGFIYWGVIFGLMLPALPVVFLRARQASQQERDRVRLFALGFAICSAPFVIETLLEIAFPPFYAWMSRELNRQIGGAILFGILMLVPIASAYSVLVDRVFNVRVTMGRAVQYALARHVLTGVAAIPLLVLAWQGIAHRDQSLADLVGSRAGLVALLLAAGGLLLVRVRQRLIARLDRIFFRSRSDHREELASFSLQVLKARESREVAEALAAHTARAFDVEDAVVLARDAERRVFLPVHGACRPLPVASAIGALVETSGSPLNVDPDDPRSLFRYFPNADREWVLDRNGSLVIPIGAPDRASFGLMLLGRKSSDVAFSRDEQLSVTSFAAAAALALENASAQGLAAAAPAAGETDVSDEAAAECSRCAAVQTWKNTTCNMCGGRLASASVPLVLLGKFKVERLLGHGGMGVVYGATDLVLGRQVAVKTLPRLSGESARRLRREARAMALVTHTNLAVIYGAESWRATPILIVEFLAGGTLAERIAKGPLPIPEALKLGIDLAGALERMHEAGVLHRDIKPSNIGFSADGVPKLLDFGLARLLDDRPETALPSTTHGSAPLSEQTTTGQFALSASRPDGVRKIVGTPLYLSPEAIAGAEPDVSFDLWSLGVVLLEAITGRNPFRASSLSGVFDRISRFTPDELAHNSSPLPQGLAPLFRTLLAARQSDRPGSARDFLEAIRGCLV